MKIREQRQRVPLRVPNGWQEQERSLVIQLETALDEIYRRLGQIEKAIQEIREQDES